LVCLSGTPALSTEDEFDLGFHNPLDKTELSWMAQPGTTEYQLLRSTLKNFSADCMTFETSELFQTDATEPVPGGALYYLVRELAPDPGGWGKGSGGFERTVSCMAPAGSMVGSYGCKERGGPNGTKLTQDCIEYQYLGGGHLLLNHLNTAFNCCPEFEAGIDFEGDTIIVWEDEISGLCDCICLFDLNYEIVNLDPGIYNVTVIQEYLDPTDEPLDFTMDLLSSPSGIHCVERDHYPW
jgi:hypothetical protein